jgi:adenylate cyclase
LKGLGCIFPITAQNADQALDLFSKATALDPDFASAHALAMVCHANRLSVGPVKDLARRRSEVARLWQNVVRVGSDDGRALAAAAFAVAFVLRDLRSANELIDHAVELNPNLVNAQAIGGWISLWLGHPELALERLRRAQRLDPASDSVVAPMAHACFFLERYEEALDQAQYLLRRHPDTHALLRIGAASAAFAGRGDIANQLASHLLEVDPAFSVSRLSEYLGPYKRPEFAEKYAEGLRLAGLPE